MVEKWLLQVQEMMIQSLKDVMQQSVDAYIEVPRSKWVVEWPGQVVLAVSSIYWTADVTTAIQEGTIGVGGAVYDTQHLAQTTSFPTTHKTYMYMYAIPAVFSVKALLLYVLVNLSCFMGAEEGCL